MMNQAQTHLTSELALKANVLDTYTREVIDSNIAALQTSTATNLALKANVLETYTQETILSLITGLQTDTAEKAELKANVLDTYTRAKINDNILALQTDTTEKLGLKYNKTEVFNTSEVDAFFAQYLELVNTKTNDEQVRAIVNAYDPYTVEAPLEKGIILATGNISLDWMSPTTKP
jgi:alpha-galactosidase